MSGTGEASADFAGEEREFCIRFREIRAIEDKCGVGIGEVLRRLARCVAVVRQLGGIDAFMAGVEIHAEDVRQPIYQGLVGKGMPSGEATKLVRLEIDERGVQGLIDNASTALLVLWGSQKVPETDEPGEGKGTASPATSPNATTSPPSTASARPLGSRPVMSTSSRRGSSPKL